MAGVLEVSTDGLRSSAAGSDADATDLAASSAGGGSNPGIAAVDAAVSAIRARQGARMSGHAGKVITAANAFDEADGNTASTRRL
ncbi:MAG: hypothetical protein H6523_12850 [Mycolicibacterium sp.]|nr:hypothetical protein [Mycolicibacterium sp.]